MLYMLKIKNIKIYTQIYRYTHLVSLFPLAERSLDTFGFGIFGILFFYFLRFAPEKTPEYLLDPEFFNRIFHTLCATNTRVIDMNRNGSPVKKLGIIDGDSGSGHRSALFWRSVGWLSLWFVRLCVCL